MDNNITPIDKFIVPIGHQQIELQNIVYEAGGMPLLRVRIREGKRFTVFDLDAQSAARWGQAMVDWASKENT